MRRSETRILTTHVGSLPTPILPQPEPADDTQRMRAQVEAVVAQQREVGLDLINEGEMTKGGTWISYVDGRFSGLQARERRSGPPATRQGKDRETFADFYDYATSSGALVYSTPAYKTKTQSANWVCSGPIRYVGQEVLARQIELLGALVSPQDGFITSVAPASLEVHCENEFFDDPDDMVAAIADAMAVEYETIAKAGFTVQVDDAWIAALWDRIGIPMGLDKFRRYCAFRIELLNHALAKVPQEQIRYHLCWGSWHGPHAFDIEMRDMVDLMLSVKAGAYSFEAANPRHEHEYVVWKDVKLPEGKVMMPGVISHASNVIEHPELVSQRIQRFAALVGREQVIASADCGFGGRTHPQIAWAKLAALTEGARLASRQLWQG